MGSDPTSRTILSLVALALVAWCVFLVRDTLPPFLIALTLASLLDPVMDRLQRRGIRRPVAVALTFGLFLAVFAGGIGMLIPLAIAQSGQLATSMTPEILQRYLDNLTASVGDLAKQLPVLDQLHIPKNFNDAVARYQPQIAGFLQGLVNWVFGVFQSSLGRLVWIVIIPIVTLYLMMDIDRIRARSLHLLPDRYREAAVDIGSAVVAVFTGYLRGLVLVCFGEGLTIGLVAALLFRLPYAFVLATIGGILYAVPYVGPVATIAIAALIAWASGRSLGTTIAVGLSVLAVNTLFDYVITPRVLGKRTGLHPVLSIFALMVGGSLFGLVGMILAVPVAASIRVVLEHFYPRLSEPLPAEEEAV